MALTLLVLAAAAGRGGDGLGEELAPAWVTDAWQAVDVGREGCALTPREEPPLPVGLRVEARLSHMDACGDRVAFVRLAGPLGPRRAEYTEALAVGLSTAPPRRGAWEGAPAVREGWIFATGSPGYAVGQSLDPARPEPVILPHGTPVSVLADGVAVVRAPWGAAAAVDAWRVREADPLIDERHDERRALRRRVIAGWTAHAARGLSALPSADALREDPALRDGRAWLVEIRREDLTADRALSPDWLDPVGQGLSRTCERPPRPGEAPPCGSYWLDFSAFGAWWMTEPSIDLIVLADGLERRGGESLPRLRVVARDPFGSHPAVSPTWDGVDPGAPTP